MMLLWLSLLMLLLILIFPKEPIKKAINVSSNGTTMYQAQGLKISEIMSDNKSALPDERGAFGDYVEIWNSTDQPIQLKDVGLSERSDKIQFLFPEMVLNANERIIVFCDDINKNAKDKTLHAKFKLSSYGCSVFLFDSTGFVVDSVVAPTLNSNESYSLMVSGNYQVTEFYSPGYENSETGHITYLENYEVADNTLMINEVMPAPRSGIYDEDNELTDWVELYNAGTESIRLENVALSDDPSKPLKWIFPKGTVIEPGQYYLVYCSGKNKLESQTGVPHTNFSIHSEGETLVLSTRTGELIDRVTVPNVGRDISYGRDPLTREFKTFTLSTPGRKNDQSGANQMDQYIRNSNYSGVYITEVLASADKVAPASGEPPCDFVEVYNSSQKVVDMSMWGLSDNINTPRKWQFPQGTNIKPGEYKVIRLDGSPIKGSGNNLHADFSLQRTGGEMMTLSDANGRVLDRLYLPETRADVSFGRSQRRDGFFYFDAPSPGQENGTGFLGYTHAPSFTLQSGLYKEMVTVEITVPEGTQVRYTTDGSIPTVDNSTVYTQPIQAPNTVVIRARAFESGLEPSSTVTASYIIGTFFTLPVVSLVCDPIELWDEETGLYAAGPNIDKTVFPFKNSVYRTMGKIARPAYLEIFDMEGKPVISQGIKAELLGAYSLDMPQKSWKVRAQASTGEKYFNYPLFKDREYTYYKSLTFRNSGNDCVWTRFSDGLQSKLMDTLDTQVLHLAWEPVIMYLNGEYWGHYNMRERKDRFSIAQHENIPMEDAEKMTILRASGSQVQGSNKEYKEMIQKIKTLSPGTNDEDLQYILDRVDVDNYFEWFAIEMYFGNSDIGNFMFYKLDGEGQKWKTLLFDLDYGLFSSTFDSPKSYLKEKGMGDQRIDNTIFRKLLENKDMQHKFLSYLSYVYNTLTPDVMMAQLEACKSAIEPAMAIHFDRWAPLNEKKINSDSPLSKDGALRYWESRISRMRNTINWRQYYLWEDVQIQFGLSDAQMYEYFGKRPPKPEGVK